MANTLKFGNGQWGTKVGSTLAYNDEGGNFKPLPFNFTRSTSGTRVNKDGLIEVVTNNKPRIDFLNDSNGALLLEPERTNLQVNSEEFDNPLWLKNRASITPNDAISPSGLLNADKLVGTSGSSSYVYDGISVTFESAYTISVFAKYIDIEEFVILNFTQSGNAYFNIENGTIISNFGTITEPKIENYGNGWYRCSAKFTATATASVNYGFYLNNATDKSVHIWGAQVELGSYPTSYIPTQGATATRVAETCNDAGNDQVFNGSEGVLFVEMSALANDSTTRRINLRNSSGSNQIRIEFGNSSNLISAVLFNGANQAVINNTSNNILNSNKIAFKYKENDFALWINGVEVGTDIIGTTIGAGILDRIDLSLSPNQTYSNIKQIQYFNTALTDLQLQQLTTL
jgi:hypothetical protein